MPYNISNIPGDIRNLTQCRGSLYPTLSSVFFLYVNPVIYIIGIPGNLLSFWIWIQKEIRNSTACYFSALSVSDTIVLVSHLVLSIQKVLGHTLIQDTTFCKVKHTVFLSTECLSGLLVLGLTVDRFIVVKYPLERYRYSTVKRTIRVIIMLILVSFTLGIIEGIWWRYDELSASCVVRPFSTSDDDHNILKYFNLSILCVVVIVPIVSILTLNVMIIQVLRRKLKKRRIMITASCISVNGVPNHVDPRILKGLKEDTEQTILLLCVSFYLIVSEAPDSFAYLLQPFFLPSYDEDDEGARLEQWRSHCQFRSVAICLETFSLTNYAFNILIYSLAGKRFRRCLQDKLTQCCK